MGGSGNGAQPRVSFETEIHNDALKKAATGYLDIPKDITLTKKFCALIGTNNNLSGGEGVFDISGEGLYIDTNGDSTPVHSSPGNSLRDFVNVRSTNSAASYDVGSVAAIAVCESVQSE